MKKIASILSAAAAASLVGCVVTSVSPFYSSKDLVSEPALLGMWTNQKTPAEVWIFQKTPGLAYRLTLLEDNKATAIEACAFTLQGQLFLDIFPAAQDRHVIPAHYLLKVTEIVPSLCLSELDPEWLMDLLAKEPALLRHYFVKTGDRPEDRRVVLTGDTPELQGFVLAHLNTKEAWKESFDLKSENPWNNLPPDAMDGTLVAK